MHWDEEGSRAGSLLITVSYHFRPFRAVIKRAYGSTMDRVTISSFIWTCRVLLPRKMIYAFFFHILL